MDNTGMICLIGILLGLIPAAIAHSKGRDFLLWWIFGAAIFILALPLSIIVAPNKTELEKRDLQSGETKKCPYCAEIIKEEAKVCRYCGTNLSSGQREMGIPFQEKTYQSLQFEDKATNSSISSQNNFVDKVREYYTFLGHDIIICTQVNNSTFDFEVRTRDGADWFVRIIDQVSTLYISDLLEFKEMMDLSTAVAGAIITRGSISIEACLEVDPKKIALVDGERFDSNYQKMLRKKDGTT